MTEQTDAAEVNLGEVVMRAYHDHDGLAKFADWLAAREAAARAEALYEARDALYRGEGPDMFEDSDIVYGEWLGNRADSIARTDGAGS